MYLAQLIVTHPLYPAAERLSRQIGRERAAGAGLAPAAELASPWEAALLEAPPVGGDLPDLLRQDWLQWEAGLLAPPPGEPAGLPADLEASRQWAFEEIETVRAQRLAAIEAEESQRLAQLRQSLVQKSLNELTNLGLDLSTPEAEVAAQVAAQRQAIWDRINGQLAQEQTASAARVALATEKLDAAAGVSRGQVEASLSEEAQRRVGKLAPLLEQPRSEMRRRLEDLVGALRPGGRPAQVLAGELEPGQIARAAQERERALQQVRATRERQLGRLVESRAGLLRGILDDTRRAVTLVAFEDNLRLHLLPAGQAQGPDLTGQVAERLRQVWTGEDDPFVRATEGYSQP